MKRDISIVTTKGQLVIPSRLRRKYGIRKGTRVVFVEQDHRLILQPLTRGFIGSLCGWLQGSKALDYLLEERKKDRAL